MKQTYYYVCLFLFVLCEVQTSKSDPGLRRVQRAVNSTSIYNTNPNKHNNKPLNDNWPQLNNPLNNTNGQYAQGYPYNSQPQNTYSVKSSGLNVTGQQWNSPDNPSNYPPQNTQGYNSGSRGHTTQPPAWDSTGQRWNSPDGRYPQGQSSYPNNYPPQHSQGYNSGSSGYATQPPAWDSTGQQWNNAGGHYNQGNNQRQQGWKPEPSNGYNPNPIRNNYQPSGYNSTSSQWNNPQGNYNQANLNNPNYPTQTGWKPQINSNSNGYNNKPAIWNSTGFQRNNPGNQHYASLSPNDLMIHHYKRSIDRRSYNGSWYNTDPDWHSDKNPLWNGTGSDWNHTHTRDYPRNWTSYNSSLYDGFRARLNISRSSIQWNNITPDFNSDNSSGKHDQRNEKHKEALEHHHETSTIVNGTSLKKPENGILVGVPDTDVNLNAMVSNGSSAWLSRFKESTDKPGTETESSYYDDYQDSDVNTSVAL